jgi:hypothetical protein
VRVHWRAATDVPLGEENERFSETGPAGAEGIEERARDDWARAAHGGSTSATKTVAIFGKSVTRISNS